MRVEVGHSAGNNGSWSLGFGDVILVREYIEPVDGIIDHFYNDSGRIAFDP